MYLNKYSASYVKQNEVIKCNKIFRPWDNVNENKIATCTQTNIINKRLDDWAQDATISTTTENEDNQAPISETKTKAFKEDLEYKKSKELNNNKHFEKGFIKVQAKTKNNVTETGEAIPKPSFLNKQKYPEENMETAQPFPEYPGSVEGYSLYPEFVQVNLAHSLGLTATDPLFLECVNQGCTLDEYTRVMNQEHQAKILSARKQRPKKYRCPHCDVGFSNNGQLKGHIRIHTGERPFRCDENNCGKTFTRNEELTRHKRIHSGLRPFPCTHCGKRFGRKDHLKKHSRTHIQPRGLYAVPVMLPFETWTASAAYPYVPMFTY